MADALGLGPSGAIRGGSSPFSRTRLEQVVYGVRYGVRLDSKSLPAVSSDEVLRPSVSSRTLAGQRGDLRVRLGQKLTAIQTATRFSGIQETIEKREVVVSTHQT
jgi:hypothetical protein